MKKVMEAYRWCKHPHWTWWLVWRTYLAAVVLTWFVEHHLFPNLTFEAVLILGFVVPPLIVAGWFAFDLAGWLVRRIRSTVETGIPLSPVRMTKDLLSERKKFADAEERWAIACRGQKIAWDGESPKLHRMQQTATGDVRARVNPAGLGGNLDLVTRLAADGTLAGIMRCKEVSVQPSGGKAWLTFYNSPPLQRAFTLADLPPSGKGRAGFGIEESGAAAAVRYGLSLLAVGATGSGKSGLFKNMFTDICRDGQPTEMYFVDPKRMELAQFKPLVGRRVRNIKIAGYCNSSAEAEAMFREFADGMHARQERLAAMGLVELTKPTEDFPVRVIVVDEMADVRATFAKLDQPLPIAISQGRATLDSVIGLAQIAKIETLGSVRDLVSLRVGMRMMTPENTKAALGISESDGAPCSRIPLSTPGVGYYVTDEGEVRKFRTAKVTDKQWSDLLNFGKLPEGMPVNVELTGPPGFTYVGYDRQGRCMYVGKAGGWPKDRPVTRRRAQHRRYDRVWCAEHERVENWWRVHVVDTHLKVTPYPSVAAALIAEERLIKELRPRFNILHNGDNPDSNAAMTRRAAARRRPADLRTLLRVKAAYREEARRAQLAAAHQERVARLQEERERFVQTVTERAA